MRRIAWILFIPLMAFNPGLQVLKLDKDFSRPSYFKKKVYDEHDWRSFNELPEVSAEIDPENPDIHPLNAAVFFASNQVRQMHGRSQLSFLPGLRDAAACHSRLMNDYGFFSHYNPYQSRFSAPEKRLSYFGVKNTSWAENISLRYIDDDLSYLELGRAIVQGWYNSPGHRQNLLDPGFRYMGCAATLGADQAWGDICVRSTQNFCGPGALTQ